MDEATNSDDIVDATGNEATDDTTAERMIVTAAGAEKSGNLGGTATNEHATDAADSIAPANAADDSATDEPSDDGTGNLDSAGNPDSAKTEAPAPLIPSADLPDLREHKTPHTAKTGTLDDSGAPQRADISRNEFTTVYDLIDQIEASLENAKTSVLFPGSVRINRAELTDQLDQLKTTLPVQLERASSLMREAERRLENAHAQAAAVVAQAQSNAEQIEKDAGERAEFLAGHERVTELAQQKARDIIGAAQAQAAKLTQGANAYCTNVMSGLQEQLDKYGKDVQNGLEVLSERQKAAAGQLTQSDETNH